jgi:hypothetical protein
MTVTSITVTDQTAALAAIERDIPTTSHAFDQAPDALHPADLPAWVNFPGAASDTWLFSDDEVNESDDVREWECRVYVAPRGAGSEGEIIRLCQPFFDSARTMFQSHQSLDGSAGVLKVKYIGDKGLNFNNLDYAGMKYSGITFRVQVTTRVFAPYAAGE